MYQNNNTTQGHTRRLLGYFDMDKWMISGQRMDWPLALGLIPISVKITIGRAFWDG